MFTLINLLARTCTPRQNAAPTEIETLAITCNRENLYSFTSCMCWLNASCTCLFYSRKEMLQQAQQIAFPFCWTSINEDAAIHKSFRKTGKALGLWATAKDILICALNLEIHKHRFCKIAQSATSQVVVTNSVLTSSSINQKLLPKWFSMVAVVYNISTFVFSAL